MNTTKSLYKVPVNEKMATNLRVFLYLALQQFVKL